MKTAPSVFRIYFNLHRKLFTVQHKTSKGWRVLRHVAEVSVQFPRFKVSEAGRQRVLREKRKNVHAFVEGFICSPLHLPDPDDMQRVSYNPYKAGTFVLRDSGTPVHGGRYVICKVDSNTRIPSMLAL